MLKKSSLFVCLLFSSLILVSAFNFENDTTFNFGKTLINKLIVIGDFNQTSGDALYNGIYGGLYLHDEDGTDMIFSVQNQWYNFTNVNCGLYNGFVCNGTAGTLTAKYSGVYEVMLDGNGEDGNNQVFELGLAINNVIQNNTLTSDETASGIRTSMASFGRVRLEAGDYVTTQIRDLSGTTIGTFYNANMAIKRIGN